MSNDVRRLAYEDFLQAAVGVGCRTISTAWRPKSGEVASRYKTTLAAVLRSQTYPAWFIFASGQGDAPYCHPAATAILLRDALRRSDYQSKFMAGYDSARGRIQSVVVVELKCSTCGRAVVIDGLHRLAWLASEGDLAAEVDVVELAGSKWSCRTPDVNLVCACLAGA